MLSSDMTTLTLTVMTFIVLSFTSIVPELQLKELPSEFHDLIPHEDKHHGHHEIEGFMTPFIPAHGGGGGGFSTTRPYTR